VSKDLTGVTSSEKFDRLNAQRNLRIPFHRLPQDWNERLRYTFDPSKLANNVRKHLVWFEEARHFDWDLAWVVVDHRHRYPETRFRATSYIHNRIYVMVFCFRETSVRLISLRKANLREIKRYANTKA
jgi:uncharacterized DUF497 family protein